MIVLNGQATEQGAGEPVAGILAALGLDEQVRGVAVAVDGEVVPRTEWGRFRVPDGARVEVLTAMQGG